MNIDQVITREEYDSIKSLSYDHFRGFMTKLVKLCVEESLKTLPQVQSHIAASAAYLRKTTEEFYKNNKDLSKHRRLVAETIEKIEGENPGLSYNEILEKAAPVVREIIPKLSNVSAGGKINLRSFDSKLKDL